MVHDGQMLREHLRDLFHQEGPMLVMKWLFFFFFWQRKMIVVLHVYRLCEACVLVCGSVSGIVCHEAKVCHVICRMMQDVENP